MKTSAFAAARSTPAPSARLHVAVLPTDSFTQGFPVMCNDLLIRRFAGVFVILSLLLGWLVSPWFYLFTAFVGLNLLQSSFTAYCPLERVLGRLGLFGCTRAP